MANKTAEEQQTYLRALQYDKLVRPEHDVFINTAIDEEPIKSHTLTSARDLVGTVKSMTTGMSTPYVFMSDKFLDPNIPIDKEAAIGRGYSVKGKHSEEIYKSLLTGPEDPPHLTKTEKLNDDTNQVVITQKGLVSEAGIGGEKRTVASNRNPDTTIMYVFDADAPEVRPEEVAQTQPMTEEQRQRGQRVAIVTGREPPVHRTQTGPLPKDRTEDAVTEPDNNEYRQGNTALRAERRARNRVTLEKLNARAEIISLKPGIDYTTYQEELATHPNAVSKGDVANLKAAHLAEEISDSGYLNQDEAFNMLKQAQEKLVGEDARFTLARSKTGWSVEASNPKTATSGTIASHKFMADVHGNLAAKYDVAAAGEPSVMAQAELLQRRNRHADTAAEYGANIEGMRQEREDELAKFAPRRLRTSEIQDKATALQWLRENQEYTNQNWSGLQRDLLQYTIAKRTADDVGDIRGSAPLLHSARKAAVQKMLGNNPRLGLTELSDADLSGVLETGKGKTFKGVREYIAQKKG